MKNLYAALIKAQSQIKPAIKDSNNPHFRSKYADLASVWDAVRDALHKNSLAVVQLPTITESGRPALITKVIHESGESLDSLYPILCKDETDPQKLLSAITYARRGALAAMLGVTAEDDDGNAAAGLQTTPRAFSPEPTKKLGLAENLVSSPRFVASDSAHKNIMMTHIKFLREKNQIWDEAYTKALGAKAASSFEASGIVLNDLKQELIKFAAENK